MAQELGKLSETHNRFEPARLLVAFNKEAASRFETGTPEIKRFILQILGSNPRLQDQELKIDAAKPFRRWSNLSDSGDLRAFLQEVRTFVADPETEEKLEKLRLLNDGDLSVPSSRNKRKAA